MLKQTVITAAILLFFIVTVRAQCNNDAPVVYNLLQTNPGEIYRPNTSAWKGGDTVRITGTSYSIIEIYGGGGGDVCRPVVIVAATSFHSDVIRFKGGAHHYKLWSTGAGKDTNSVRSISTKNVALDQAHHITVEGLKIRGADVGFYNKMNVSYADQNSWYPNFPMTGNKLIGCWVSDIGGEGIYSGLTQENGYVVTSSWSGLDTTIVGNRCDSTVIMNCRVERTLWDGIQLAHSGYGNIIANNDVYDYGKSDLSGQSAGIILGGDCNGDVYGNNVEKGTGNGIEIFGFGSINVYNNSIIDAGVTTRDPVNGEESLYCVYHTVTYISRPPLALYIHDNYIKNPQPKGAIRNSANGNEIASLIRNNRFCIPGATGSWQDEYLIFDVSGTVNTNNILSCTETQTCNCLRNNVRYIN